MVYLHVESVFDTHMLLVKIKILYKKTRAKNKNEDESIGSCEKCDEGTLNLRRLEPH